MFKKYNYFLIFFISSFLYLSANETIAPISPKQPSDSDISNNSIKPSFSDEQQFRNYYQESTFPALIYLTARQDLGPGIGYDKSYTTFETLIFTELGESWTPFLDFKIHNFYDEKYAANAGGGLRYFSNFFQGIFGFNFYYDYRKTNFDSFNQVGVGLEFLSNWFNLRLNGYFPINEKTKLMFCVRQTSGDFFLERRNYNEALPGWNLDGEIRINPSCPFLIYILGGPYLYYGNNFPNVVGGRVGLSVWYGRSLFLRVTGTFDNVFKKRVQGVVGLTFPLGWLCNLKCCGVLNEILLDTVKRNEIIALGEYCRWKWNY